MKRREFLKLSFGSAAVAVWSSQARADAGVKAIRIGYQKNGVLVIARQRATLEDHFRPAGIEVKWVEFSSGPPVMEAMNVGSIDWRVRPAAGVRCRLRARRSCTRPASPSPTARASWCRKIRRSAPSPI
jgi:ABC-type nitrate/sulfonate/bicarbonate transport system substrate-binding protein